MATHLEFIWTLLFAIMSHRSPSRSSGRNVIVCSKTLAVQYMLNGDERGTIPQIDCLEKALTPDTVLHEAPRQKARMAQAMLYPRSTALSDRPSRICLSYLAECSPWPTQKSGGRGGQPAKSYLGGGNAVGKADIKVSQNDKRGGELEIGLRMAAIVAKLIGQRVNNLEVKDGIVLGAASSREIHLDVDCCGILGWSGNLI